MKALHFLDDNIEKIICVFCLAVMSVLIFVQVIFRYVLHNSLSWSEEIARYLFIWLIYIGISYGVKMDKHICVDAVSAMLPERINKRYVLIGYVLFLFFAVCAVYYGIIVVGKIAASGQLTPATQLPMQVIYLAPVVGFALTSLRLVQQFILGIKGLRETDDTVNKEGAK